MVCVVVKKCIVCHTFQEIKFERSLEYDSATSLMNYEVSRSNTGKMSALKVLNDASKNRALLIEVPLIRTINTVVRSPHRLVNLEGVEL
ncbi:hypothetical protein GIB67_021934, partial [Kingdonia uniflora]